MLSSEFTLDSAQVAQGTRKPYAVNLGTVFNGLRENHAPDG